MTRCLSILLIAVGLAAAAPLQAQDQARNQAQARGGKDISWYQVEVIVFEYTRPETEGESWYANPGLPHEENSINLITSMPNPPAPGQQARGKDLQGQGSSPLRIPYLELSPDHDNLDEVYHILTISSAYRPLYHATWEQPGLADDQARYVHFSAVRGGEGTDVPAQGPDAAPSEAAAPGAELVGPAYLPPPPPAFDAMLRLRVSQFLHLDLDVAYFPEDPSILEAAGGQVEHGAEGEAATAAGGNAQPGAGGEAQPGVGGEVQPGTGGEAANDEVANGETEFGQSPEHADYVRLTESRRVRLKELHYFDHPLFGVIVQVTRLEDKKKGEE